MEFCIIHSRNRLELFPFSEHSEKGWGTIGEAAGGLTGIERFSLVKPDLIILDLTMPGMSEMEVVNKLRQIGSNVPVIVATADAQPMTHQDVMAMGAKSFVNKPFTAEEVQVMVQLLLREPV